MVVLTYRASDTAENDLKRIKSDILFNSDLKKYIVETITATRWIGTVNRVTLDKFQTTEVMSIATYILMGSPSDKYKTVELTEVMSINNDFHDEIIML